MDRQKLIVILGASLFISLTANMLMAGLMVGKSWHHEAEWRGDSDDWRKRDQALREKLPEADRKVIKEAMQAKRQHFQEMRAELDAARDKVFDAESAEPFDQAKLDDALRAEKEKKQALLQDMRQTREEVSKKLSPEGREVFSKLGPGGPRMGGQGWGRFKGGFMGDRANGPQGGPPEQAPSPQP
jgi:Spy/CpxP family protein refolding chaperone